MQSSKPVSHINLDAELEACVSTKREAQALPQRLNARLEARVSITKKTRISVITALITGVNYCPCNEGVNPHYGVFLGDSFNPETPINSSVYYWRGVQSWWSEVFGSNWRILIRTSREKYLRVQLFKQLVEYKFVLTSSLFEIFLTGVVLLRL